VRLLVGPGRLHRSGGSADGPRSADAPDDAPTRVGSPDALSVAEAAALARRLARYRPAGSDPTGEPAPRAAHGLPALLGLDSGPAGIAALRARWAAPRPTGCASPSGSTSAVGR
jgi:S-DNA-T family DNA segregation ATPase FtsK/SpoIIIE